MSVCSDHRNPDDDDATRDELPHDLLDALLAAVVHRSSPLSVLELLASLLSAVLLLTDVPFFSIASASSSYVASPSASSLHAFR